MEKRKQGIYLRENVIEQIEAYIELTGQTKSGFLEMVAVMFIQNLQKHKPNLLQNVINSKRQIKQQLNQLGL